MIEEPESITISFIDGEVTADRYNTNIYEFENRPDMTHVFTATREDDEGNSIGVFIWERELLEKGSHDDWKGVVAALGKIGVETIREANPSESDKDVYRRRFGAVAVTSQVELVLSCHDEALIAFWAHLLKTDKVTPEDFNA